MSATPPGGTPPPQQRQGYGLDMPARLPIPGNAEWLLWLLVEIVFAVIWAASDAVDASGFVTATAAITFAYLISRGIAKASRVFEQ